MSAHPKPAPRPVMRFKFSTDGVPEFIAMWRLLRDLCDRHGFGDDHLYLDAEMRFTGVGEEQLEALLSACEEIDLSPEVRYE